MGRRGKQEAGRPRKTLLPLCRPEMKVGLGSVSSSGKKQRNGMEGYLGGRLIERGGQGKEVEIAYQFFPLEPEQDVDQMSSWPFLTLKFFDPKRQFHF